jgi:hypothetical protein
MDYMPVVVHAEYCGDYNIEIEFDNGIKKTIDFSAWLDGGIFEPLKDKEYFKKFFVDGFTISWPNGADIDPDTLYKEKPLKAA